MPCLYTTSELSLFENNSSSIHKSSDNFASSNAHPHFQPSLPLFPKHLDLHLSFNIESRNLIATASHQLVSKIQNAKTITLNAEDFLNVHVSSKDDDKLLYTYDGHLIDITFSNPIPKDDVVSIDIKYELKDPIDGLFFSNENDGFFVFSDHETERARYWLPLVDHPVVRTTISFTILTPVADNLTVLANGAFISEENQSTHKVTKWEMNQLTPSYLISVAIGKFIRQDASDHNGKKIAYFAPKDARFSYTQKMLDYTFGRTNEMIQFMENKVKFPLPWPKYYQVCCGSAGGAMENSSLVYFDEWYMLDDRSFPERSFRVDSTVVHELAHTWFGDTVVCSDFCHSFLKEAFATFISAEWYHHKYGNDDFQLTLTRYAEVSFAETLSYVRPIVTRTYDSSWDLFDRHLYTNGAWRLHMLRNKLGDKIFWDAVSSYLHKRAWQTVETDDFRRDLEEYSGEQLCSYFDQWFYGKGHPVLEASFSYDSSKGGYMTISLEQVQCDNSKDMRLFDLDIDVAIEVSEGNWETYTVSMESGKMSGQIIQKLSSRPLQVVIDPEKKVLYSLSEFRGLGEDISLRSLVHAPTFAGRYQAMKLLKESGTKRSRNGLCEALSSEKHWGLRSSIASAIGTLPEKDALSALIPAISTESDARVLPSIINSIGKFKALEAEPTLLRFINDGQVQKRGYGAIGAALNALAGLGKIEHLDLFTSYLEDPSKVRQNFLLSYEAAVALGQLRDWRATEVLMRNAKPPNMLLSERARCSVVRAIGVSVQRETRNARIKTFEFIKDIVAGGDVKRVRIVAARVLAGLADVGDAIRPLVQLEKEVENQTKGNIQEMRVTATSVKLNRAEGATKELSLELEKMRKKITDMNSSIEELKAKVEVLSKENKDKTVNGNSKPMVDGEAKDQKDSVESA